MSQQVLAKIQDGLEGVHRLRGSSRTKYKLGTPKENQFKANQKINPENIAASGENKWFSGENNWFSGGIRRTDFLGFRRKNSTADLVETTK